MYPKIREFFTNKLFSTYKYITILWFSVTFLAIVKTLISGRINNYLIFKFTFFSLINQLNFFLPQPENFLHYNLYGPIFSLLIAPFALLPNWLGMSLWMIFNTWVLYWAVKKLPLSKRAHIGILLIVLHENLTSILNCQFNPCMTAIIILSFVFINGRKDFWAAFLIVLGTFVKLYGIVGLAFFFFSKNKTKLMLSLLFWGVIMFILPMFFSSPKFILQSYIDWYVAVAEKNQLNSDFTCGQDICLMGIIRRTTKNQYMANWPYILMGVTLLASTYLRIKQYKNLAFKLLLLSNILIFTVIFSTSAESPTYIIAFLGVAIWFIIQPRPFKWDVIALLVFAIILTSFSPSDLFPKFIRENYIYPYSLKALPCVLIWFRIIYEMLTKDFTNYNIPVES
jgi:hypothetical protein